MNRAFLVLFICLMSTRAYDQEKKLYPYNQEMEVYPDIYFGTGSGINNFNGFLGFFAEGNIVHNFTLSGGLGIGAWGYKMAVAARYYREYPHYVFYGLGFSSCTGINSIEMEVATEPADEYELVEFKFMRANSLNFSLGYQFKIFRKSRIYVELGYGIRLQTNPYEIITPNVELSEASIQTMDMLVPGGLILGVGYSIGI